jgi:hypothetical protein
MPNYRLRQYWGKRFDMSVIDDSLAFDASGEEGIGGTRRKEEPTDSLDFGDGIPMTCAEMAAEVNAIARGENPPPGPRPCHELWTEEDERIAEAESPSHLSNDPPFGFRFPEEVELNGCGIYETMFDTLPEMDIIIENECIM